MTLFLSLLSMILALIVLAFNWKVNRNALFLSLVMILIATSQLRQYLVLNATEPFWLAVFVNNPSPLWSMTGACLFFYVRSVLTDRFEFRKSDMRHTLPFWISLVGIMPYLLTPFSHKIRVANLFIEKMDVVKQINFNWMMSHEVSLQLRYLLQIGYAIACLWMIAKYQRRRKQNTTKSTLHGKLIEKWLVAVSVFVLLTGLYYFVGAFLYFRNPSLARNITARYYEIYVFGVVLACLPSLVLIFPEILHGIPRRRAMPAIPQPMMGWPIQTGASVADAAASPQDSHPETPSLPVEAEADSFQELGQRVLDFMEREKPYLSRDFSIEDLADMLNVPRHHIYHCFRTILKTRFVSLRTEFRIREAQRRLLEADLKQTTLYSIGQACGFSSHSAFYRTFREIAGCSPGEFLEQHKRTE